MKNILEKEIQIKICLVGDEKVGKTSLIRSFNRESFNEIYEPTLVVKCIYKKIKFINKEIELNIWDSYGNEKFRKVNKSFYKDSAIIIFVYDITNKNTFENIKNFWYKDIQTNFDSKPMMVIVGNKTDLYEAEEVKEEEEARDYAKSINSKFKLFSAKEDFGFGGFLYDLIGDYLLPE